MTITSRKSRPHGTLDGADAALRVASQPGACDRLGDRCRLYRGPMARYGRGNQTRPSTSPSCPSK